MTQVLQRAVPSFTLFFLFLSHMLKPLSRGWIFLQAAWLMAIAILIVMMGGLGVAIYLAMNIEQLAEEHWDENIQPELEATHTASG